MEEHIIIIVAHLDAKVYFLIVAVFYSEWMGGKDSREAFHIAQQRLSEKYEPCFWGAFMLVKNTVYGLTSWAISCRRLSVTC